MKEYIVLSEEMGEEYRDKSLIKVYSMWRRLVNDDKQYHDKKTYYFIKAETVNENGKLIEYQTEGKIYKRANKVFFKASKN